MPAIINPYDNVPTLFESIHHVLPIEGGPPAVQGWIGTAGNVPKKWYQVETIEVQNQGIYAAKPYVPFENFSYIYFTEDDIYIQWSEYEHYESLQELNICLENPIIHEDEETGERTYKNDFTWTVDFMDSGFSASEIALYYADDFDGTPLKHRLILSAHYPTTYDHLVDRYTFYPIKPLGIYKIALIVTSDTGVVRRFPVTIEIVPNKPLAVWPAVGIQNAYYTSRNDNFDVSGISFRALVYGGKGGSSIWDRVVTYSSLPPWLYYDASYGETVRARSSYTAPRTSGTYYCTATVYDPHTGETASSVVTIPYRYNVI